MFTQMSRLVLVAAAVFAVPALSLPALEADCSAAETVAKRDSVALKITSYKDASCQLVLDNGFLLNPGQCHTIPTDKAFSTEIYNPNDQTCVLKFWSNTDCTGSATTWWAGRDEHPVCFQSPTQQGVLKLGNGVGSVIANCAKDKIPS